jgi:septum site-determining protein MinC
MKNTVSIKGTREGLTITLGSGDLPSLLEDLTQHLITQGAFFRGGTVALQVGERAIRTDELTRIGELLTEHEMMLRSVVTTSAITQQSVKTLGLRLVEQETPPQVQESAVTPRPQASPAVHPLEGSRGLLIRHVVRSGQVIRHTGHVAVIGDVNVGGEIIAGGDVVIWGRLYGTVHAGAAGNASAVVCALELAPLQLRIGDLIARSDEDDRPKKPNPEIAYVRDNLIVVEPWDRAPRGA